MTAEGAVAIDKEGNIASAVSSGGIWLKMHGRIGDSAIIGSGIYADNKSGASCATGYGEYIMRLCTYMAAIYAAVSVGNLVNRNKTWQEAVEELNFRIYQKNGFSSNGKFIMSSMFYHCIYFKAWS